MPRVFVQSNSTFGGPIKSQISCSLFNGLVRNCFAKTIPSWRITHYGRGMGIIASPGLVTGWPTARPEDVGLAADLGSRLDHAFGRHEYAGLHGFLAVRHGMLAVERYYPGQDERWGTPLPDYAHGPALLHDVRSITKSIVGLLYGLALHAGQVPAASEKLADAFPEYPHLKTDPLKRRITIGHVLSMRMGLKWDESLAYDDPANAEIRMETSGDRVRFVLEQPMEMRSGAEWVYCGGATALLGALIERGTGQRLEDFARERLFAPMGIEAFEWVQGVDGRAAASSGLRLTARDLARIGQMLLDRGSWNGRRIVPSSWITTSMKPRADVEATLRYGYQWWLGQLASNGRPWYAAFGNGGQRLFAVPSLKMVVVIFAGNYNQPDQWKMPIKLMSKIVIPSVRER